MKTKSESFLYHSLWMAESPLKPVWRDLDGSFEAWAYQGNCLRQAQTLEAGGWLETAPGPGGRGRRFRLTPAGCLRAIGGCLPTEFWDHPWDGHWRTVVFDFPETRRTLRNELRRDLRAHRFGCLQGGMWISPHPLEPHATRLRQRAGNCGSITCFESRTCCGDQPADIIAKAWDLTTLHQLHEQHLEHLTRIPRPGAPEIRGQLLQWGRIEKSLWVQCLAHDPLLPRELWPDDYLGETTWTARLEALALAGQTADTAA